MKQGETNENIFYGSKPFRKIHHVLVIGAGTMGWQIAQLFAQHRMSVVLADLSENQLETAKALTKANLLKQELKGKLSPHRRERILSHLTYTTDWSKFISTIDLVIEAVPEILLLKQQIFHQLANLVLPGTICATNSSTIGVNKIVANLPSSFTKYTANIHFSNPPLMLRLIEIYAFSLDPQFLAFLKQFFRRLRYEPIIIRKPVNGFIMNRLLGGALREVFWLLEQKVCDPQDIDIACTAGLKWPIGLARLCDIIGLDVVYNSFQASYEDTQEKYYRPPSYLQNLIDQKKLGVKTKEGIYHYKSIT